MSSDGTVASPAPLTEQRIPYVGGSATAAAAAAEAGEHLLIYSIDEAPRTRAPSDGRFPAKTARAREVAFAARAARCAC